MNCVRPSSNESAKSFRFLRFFRGFNFDRAKICRTGKDDNRERYQMRQSEGDGNDLFETRPGSETGNSMRQPKRAGKQRGRR